MYDKCYFCLDQLPKVKKESTDGLFRKFWRSRGTKEPAYITVGVGKGNCAPDDACSFCCQVAFNLF